MLEAQAEEIERLTTLCEETQMERRTLQYEVSVERDRAEAAERERDALKVENERLREALKTIDLRTNGPEDGSTYAHGWSDARFRMREIARAALHPTQGGE